MSVYVRVCVCLCVCAGCVYVCMTTATHITKFMWKSEDSWRELVLYFLRVGSGAGRKVVRPVGKHSCSLAVSLASPSLSEMGISHQAWSMCRGTDVCYCTQRSSQGWSRFRFRSSGLCSRDFTRWTNSPATWESLCTQVGFKLSPLASASWVAGVTGNFPFFWSFWVSVFLLCWPRTCCVDQIGLELTEISCLSLASTGIKGVHYHGRLYLEFSISSWVNFRSLHPERLHFI